MDDDGFVYFLDRMKDFIRRRGENISTWEIESTINTHPAVLESRRLRRAFRAERVGGDGRSRTTGGRDARSGGAARLLPGQDGLLRDPALRAAHGRACRRTMPSGCRSSSCARRASRPTPGTARRTATRYSDDRDRPNRATRGGRDARRDPPCAPTSTSPRARGRSRLSSPRARRPVVGVHRRRADAEPPRRRRARVCSRDAGGARARRERGGVAPVRARARGRRGLPRLDPRPAMVRRSHRDVRHGVLCLDRALPVRHRSGTK